MSFSGEREKNERGREREREKNERERGKNGSRKRIGGVCAVMTCTGL